MVFLVLYTDMFHTKSLMIRMSLNPRIRYVFHSLPPFSQEAIFLEGRHGRAVKLGECVIVRRARHPLLCFARINPSCDWVHDLGARLAYERQVRMME